MRTLLRLGTVAIGCLLSFGEGRLVGAVDQVRLQPGAIRGQVLDLVTQAPVRKAVVRAQSSVLSEARIVLTDGDGRYQFSQLPPGEYSLVAGKMHYIDQPFGRTRAQDPPRVIRVAAGQVADGANLLMVKGAVIAGRIVDELGEPVEAVIVTVLGHEYGVRGRQSRAVARSAPTNDLGEYRVAGLAAGRYLLAATLPDASDVFGDMGTWVDRSAYAPSYYPGTGDLDAAEGIDVRLGEVALERDIALKAVRTAWVRGRVVSRSGAPQAGRRVTASSAAALDPVRVATVTADGTFTLSGVPVGDYVLRLTGDKASGEMTGSAMVTVSHGDIEGVEILVAPPSQVKGRVRFEGSLPKRPVASAFRLLAAAVSPDGGAGDSTQVREDLSFSIATAAGRFLLRLEAAPVEWTLKRVRVNQVDVTDRGFDVPPAGVVDVDVLLTNADPELSIDVSDRAGDPVRDCLVLVFARDRALWSYQSRHIAAVRPTRDNRFITRLPAGDYYAVAVDDAEPGAWYDPTYLSAKIGGAVAVSLATAGPPSRVHLSIER